MSDDKNQPKPIDNEYETEKDELKNKKNNNKPELAQESKDNDMLDKDKKEFQKKEEYEKQRKLE
jgi:hypothetical protein